MAAANNLLLPRSATKLSDGDNKETRGLSEWRDLGAYVLLGEPGMGKSSAFMQEFDGDPSGSVFISARDFVTIGLPPGSEGKTLFIDALDERRASSSTHHGPLDEIRIRLNALGRPRFRLSCREADWIAADKVHLCAVAPSGTIEELRLEPLDEAEALSLLESWGRERVKDPQTFVETAQQQRLGSLLGNPLLLGLLVDAVNENVTWPASRQETYLLACRHLAVEHNDEHRAAQQRVGVDVDAILRDAGLLSALLMLSDHNSYVVDGIKVAAGEILVDRVPGALNMSSVRAAQTLASKLFAADGARRVPRHRTIAEFLAARSIAGLIAGGLPISRILALMAGFDGRIVEPLRGLYAWLAAHCAVERSLLIDRDPLGLILYGDVHPFANEDKRRLLNALYKEGDRFRWFRNENWDSHPFGALGTMDMESTFRDLLKSPAREPAHEVLLDCVMDAIEHGVDMPGLTSALEQVVRDSTHFGVVRTSALDALLKPSMLHPDVTKRLLIDIARDKLSDPDDELAGHLLAALYPEHLPASEVMQYFHVRKDKNLIGRYHMFWAADLIRRTSPKELPLLADNMAIFLEHDRDTFDEHEVASLAGRLLYASLLAHGESEPIERIYKWLHALIGEHGSLELRGNEADAISKWLTAHPVQYKELFAYALLQEAPRIKSNHREFWRCEELLFRAQRPSDWFSWLLHQASNSPTEKMAQYCFELAAHAAVSPSTHCKISLEEVEDWVRRNASRWPEADRWLQEMWTCEVTDWRREEYQRERERSTKRETNRLKRQQQVAPHMPKLFVGAAPPQLVYEVALAYQGRFSARLYPFQWDDTEQ